MGHSLESYYPCRYRVWEAFQIKKESEWSFIFPSAYGTSSLCEEWNCPSCLHSSCLIWLVFCKEKSHPKSQIMFSKPCVRNSCPGIPDAWLKVLMSLPHLHLTALFRIPLAHASSTQAFFHGIPSGQSTFLPSIHS